jgi:hypothetical protein
VAGGRAVVSGNRNFGLTRYNTDGSLDTTFSGDRKVTTDFAGSFAQAFGARSDHQYGLRHGVNPGSQQGKQLRHREHVGLPHHLAAVVDPMRVAKLALVSGFVATAMLS